MIHEVRIQEGEDVRRITLHGKPFAHVRNGEVVLVWGIGARTVEISGPLLRTPDVIQDAPECSRCEELEDKLEEAKEEAEDSLDEERLAKLTTDLEIF